MSIRWPMAKQCHTVLSNLMETFRFKRPVSKYAPEKSDIHNWSLGTSTNDVTESQDHGLDPVPNGEAGHKRRRIALDNSMYPETSDEMAEGSTSRDNTGEADFQDVEASINDAGNLQSENGNQAGVPSQGYNLESASLRQPTESPFTITEPQNGQTPYGPISADTTQFDPLGTIDVGYSGNWDSGMLDVFSGATWESLLNAVNFDAQL